MVGIPRSQVATELRAGSHSWQIIWRFAAYQETLWTQISTTLSCTHSFKTAGWWLYSNREHVYVVRMYHYMTHVLLGVMMCENEGLWQYKTCHKCKETSWRNTDKWMRSSVSLPDLQYPQLYPLIRFASAFWRSSRKTTGKSSHVLSAILQRKYRKQCHVTADSLIVKDQMLPIK